MEMGLPKGPWRREGDTLPWFVQDNGNENLLAGIVAGIWYLRLETFVQTFRPSNWLRYLFPWWSHIPSLAVI
jgi:hypothetical protein